MQVRTYNSGFNLTVATSQRTLPNVISVFCDNTLEEVTTEGFLVSTDANPITVSDMILVEYDGGLGWFTPSIVDDVITLTQVVGSIPDGSVTTAKLDDEAVTDEKLADDAVTTTKILNDAVTLTKLAPGITPSHVVFTANTTLTTGGSPTEFFTIPGILVTDIVMVTIRDFGTVPVNVLESRPDNAGHIVVVFSGDPSNDTRITYSVLRAAS